ncbi:673_t:CDS:2 [Entrophospora sp. SA101]|nr:673_t:CDS:2 [Entrophospora sp. SA101]
MGKEILKHWMILKKKLVETGRRSFQKNALIKARSLDKIIQEPALGEDCVWVIAQQMTWFIKLPTTLTKSKLSGR